MAFDAAPHRSTLVLVGAVTVAIAVAVALSMLPVQSWLIALGERLHAFGAVTALIAFGTIYVICAMALVPASALSLVAGLLFGLSGIVLSWIAMVVVAGISFPLARRALARPVRQYLNQRPRVRTVGEVIDEGGWRMVLLIRVSGLIPFGLQNYVLGTTKVAFAPYLLASSVGFLPSILVYGGSGAFGKAAIGYAGSGPLCLALLGLAVLASLTLIVVTARKIRSRLQTRGALNV